MKNVGTFVLGALALSLCCAAPLIIAWLSLAILAWLTSSVALVSLAVVVGTVLTIVWIRRRQKRRRECEDPEENSCSLQGPDSIPQSISLTEGS